MDKTISILKNINFWGLLICNLAIGYEISKIVIKTLIHNKIENNPEIIVIFCSFFVILIHFILFNKINLEGKPIWKLLFYSFIIYVSVAFPSYLVFWTSYVPYKGVFNLFAGIMVGVLWAMFPYYLLFMSVNFLWLLREKNKNQTTSILNNINFGLMMICNLVLFYAFRENGLFVFNSQFTIFSILAIAVYWFLFKKMIFLQTTWKLVFYSVLIPIFLISLTWYIRLLIIFNSDPEFPFPSFIASVFGSIKRGYLFILFSSIVTFCGFFKEKYDENKSDRQVDTNYNKA
ncbi:MAG: hypothetical protein LBR52_02820 [Prevotellaceae bacterium]|nr:hypothetical protein [Prevotellaceae bacterium]